MHLELPGMFFFLFFFFSFTNNYLHVDYDNDDASTSPPLHQAIANDYQPTETAGGYKTAQAAELSLVCFFR
jgi:hypothetical protein